MDSELKLLQRERTSTSSSNPPPQANMNASSHSLSSGNRQYSSGESCQDEVLIDLSERDFAFALELEFPPAGSNNAATRMTVNHSSSRGDMSSKFSESNNSFDSNPDSPSPRNGESHSNESVKKSVSFQEESNFVLGGTPTPPHKLSKAFKFKDYMPKPFRVIRSLSGIDEGDYMLSVAGN